MSCADDPVAAAVERRARRRRRPWIGRLLLVLGIWWGMGLGVAWFTVAPLHGRSAATPAAYGARSYQDLTLRSADGTKLAAWIMPAKGRTRGVVIGCHGIGADRVSLLPFAETMNRHGCTVILFDFRARGRSGGGRCTIGYRETDDVLAAIACARTNAATRGLPVVLYGQSLGAACAIMAAARCPDVRAVVAESAFSRLDRAIDNHFRETTGWFGAVLAVPTVWWGERLIGCHAADISPEDAMRQVPPRPVLLIQDADDRQAPPSETDILVKASGGAAQLWTVPGADHVCAQIVAPAEFENRVVRFVDSVLRGTAGHAATP